MRFRFMFNAAAAVVATSLAACAGAGSPPAQPAFGISAVPAATNAISNGCFDSGTKPWTLVKGKANGKTAIVSGGYGSCKHAAYAGTLKPPAPNGFYGVLQTVKVTTAGKLSWWYWGGSNDSIKYGDQEVDVVVGGKIVDTCYKALVTNTNKAWKLGTCSLKKYAGQTVGLQFGVYDNGYSKTYDNWYVSDITLQ